MMQTTNRDVFHAIAEPTRRSILKMLLKEDMTPNAIAGRFPMSRQAVSRHVGVLADCGLLSQRQAGREIYYQLNIPKMKEVDRWLEPFRKIWEDKFGQLDDLLTEIE